jgi:hypothetical protein
VQMQTVWGWQSARLLEKDEKAGGCLKAHFNSQLVNLITEARQLRSLGYSIPREIEREIKVCTFIFQWSGALHVSDPT